MKSRILGFDFRIGQSDKSLNEHWPERRRGHYLLRSDVSAPLSVDTTVWPSLFDFDNRRSNTFACPPPANENYFHHQGLRLWANLPEMKRTVEANNNLPKTGCIACFTLEYEDSTMGEERWRMAFDEPTVPFSADTHWELKGYDVADRFCTSGLSNCGYNADEIEQARAVWSHSINTNGLFSSAGEALRFKEYSDKRVHSHAPFYVLWIYTI